MTASSPGAGVLRLARALAWACAAGGLSTGAHVAGGGGLPSPGGAALIALALLWSGLLLTRWRLGRTALAVTLGGSQVLLHAVLTAAETPAACAVSGGHHESVAACAGGASMAHTTSGAMVLAHAVAALLLALLLAHGEDAVWLVAGLLRPRLPAPARLSALPLRPVVPAHEGGVLRTVTVLGGVGRRGPPVRRALP